MPTENPFIPAEILKKRLKLLVWGKSGVGKTRLALEFPDVVIVDFEKGTEPYAKEMIEKGKKFHANREEVASFDDLKRTIHWLMSNDHHYKTFVVDPISVAWDLCQAKWAKLFLAKRTGKVGHKGDFYDIQPGDWRLIKADWKSTILAAIALDMNIIFTAHDRVLYKDSGLMVPVGHTYEAEKNTHFLFDTVLRIRFGKDSKHRILTMERDRNRMMEAKQTKEVEFDEMYKLFETWYGKDSLEKDAKPITKES